MHEGIHSYTKENPNNRESLSKTDIIIDPETKIKYKKGRKLGGGGFGEVYEFIDIETNKKRAAKIIPNSRIDNDPQSNIAYTNEYKFNTYLDFKYLCKCHSTFKDNQNAYFILDYQPNKTLSELLHKRQLSEIEIKHYCFELLLAIEYLHKRNIIHRDIKLSNVLLSEKMEVRLCDFGLAIENGIDGQKNICGTPNYIAPELLNHKNGLNYSFEIDIWAFGVMLYSLYYHKTPFEQEIKGKTKYNIQNIIYSFPKEVTISKEAKDLISSILVKDPSQRPKIDQIKASAFFKNGEGIPKYLPPFTMIRAMSQEEEENFINNAIMNGECLDKEVNLANKDTPFSIRTKYYNRVNNEPNEDDSNYIQSESSSNDEEDKNEEKINNKKSNNIENNKDENSNRDNFTLNNENNLKSEEEINNKNNNKEENVFFNKDKEIFNNSSNNNESKNNSREDTNKNIKVIANRQPSTKKDLNNFSNNKSFGKLNETAGFISNNLSNLSSSNSDFFSPTTKCKDKEDSSNVIKEEMNLNDGDDKDIKKTPKFKYKSINQTTEKDISKSDNENSIENKKKNKIANNRIESYIKYENLINKSSLDEKNNIMITKFIDLSDKCGIGYILTNGDVGAYFNDSTKMVRIKCTLNFVYINELGKMILINTKKKISDNDHKTKINALLLFNKSFIKNSKNRNSFDVNPKIHKKTIDLYVKKWVKSQHAYFFLLSNEKVQVMFDDKTQIFFDFQNKKVTFINKSKQIIIQNITQSKFSDEEMNKRVKYAKKILAKM
jgi:polo-like kinase 1